MYVVRIETDEALMFRAFRKLQAAKFWANARQGADDFDTVIDIYDVPGIEDEMHAVKSIRDGSGKLVLSGARLPFHDIRQNANFLAGVGIGTGAGF